MNPATQRRRRQWLQWLGMALAAVGALAGCGSGNHDRLQGYVEGEFVYIASPAEGALETLHVQRGAQVNAGDPLYALEHARETAARNEAQRRLDQARANLEDAKKGRRPSEIEAVVAQLKEAQAALDFATRELARQEELLKTNASSIADRDRARWQRDANAARVDQLQAELATAYLGARVDQVEAAAKEVAAREAVLAQAEWDLEQTHQAAPEDALVFDTLYREGEWVAAGRPVVALLPPRNVKVRAFVPEPRIAGVQVGQRARVIADGLPEPLVGTVSFVSPRAEFTPPVIYSRESRSKLVFLIELVFDPEVAASLHPGQPVDVELEP